MTRRALENLELSSSQVNEENTKILEENKPRKRNSMVAEFDQFFKHSEKKILKAVPENEIDTSVLEDSKDFQIIDPNSNLHDTFKISKRNFEELPDMGLISGIASGIHSIKNGDNFQKKIHKLNQ